MLHIVLGVLGVGAGAASPDVEARHARPGSKKAQGAHKGRSDEAATVFPARAKFVKGHSSSYDRGREYAESTAREGRH